MTRSTALRRVFLVFLLVFLQACSIYSLPGSKPAPVEGQPDYSVVTPPPAPRDPAPTPAPSQDDALVIAAYQPLLEKAEQARQRGDYEQALALLERAQRIDPDSPDIYLAMAQTHSARGDSSQAQATAQRGLLYCTGSRQCDALRAFAQ